MRFKSFIEKYFSINLSDYPNIGIDLEINKLLFFLMLGLVAAVFIINFSRTYMKLLVTRLTRYSCNSEDTARTLEELKLDNIFVRYILSNNKRIKDTVSRVGEKSYTYEEYVELSQDKKFKEEKIDFATAKFFISEDRRAAADELLNMKDASLFATVLFALFIFSLFVCLILLMPELLPWINSLYG